MEKLSLRLTVLVIFARFRNCRLLCLARVSLILKIAACPTLVLLGDLGYFYSNSLLVWVSDWKVRARAGWRINVSGANGGRNQHFIKEWHLLLDCKVRRPRLAVREACWAAWEEEQCFLFYQLGSQCWKPFLFLIRHLEALLTSHHLLRFCSQVTPSSPWDSGCLEGPEPCVNKAETWWDGIKAALFCMQENTALWDASSFFHPCCHAGFSPKAPGAVPMAPLGEQDEIGVW